MAPAMAPWLAALLAFVAGLLLGSIPFGLLLTRAAGMGDIRAIGPTMATVPARPRATASAPGAMRSATPAP